jgi:hypothetical protein
MHYLLKSGSSTGAISTCRSPSPAKLKGHEAMLVSCGVSFSADEVTRNVEMAATTQVEAENKNVKLDASDILVPACRPRRPQRDLTIFRASLRFDFKPLSGRFCFTRCHYSPTPLLQAAPSHDAHTPQLLQAGVHARINGV